MGNNKRIIQILDQSACLSKGQLLGYLKHNLYPEELRAVELHLNGCPFCNDALEGFEQLPGDPAHLLTGLVPPVLPAMPLPEKPKEKKEPVPATKQANPQGSPRALKKNLPTTEKAQPSPGINWKLPAGIAAALVIGGFSFWLLQLKSNEDSSLLADNSLTDTATLNMDTGQLQMHKTPPAVLPEKPVIEIAKDSLNLAKKEPAPVKAEEQVQLMQAAVEVKKAEPNPDETENGDLTETTDPIVERPKPAVARASSVDDTPKAAKAKEIKEDLSDFGIGLGLYKQKQYAGALLYMRSAEANSSDPMHWDAVYYSALCNKELGKRRKAIRLFERIVKADAPRKNAAQKQLDELNKKR